MSEVIIRVNNLSKQYRLGQIGTGTIREDLNRFWARLRGKEDPTLKIGQSNVLNTMSQGVEKGDTEYVWALQNISFEVQKGEVLGIIGKNGAGKSTLLKILSKVTAPTTGSVRVKGRIASLLEVGTGFHPELSGRENIFLNGAILGMTKSEIRKKFDEIVDFAGVVKYIDTPVKRYSSGMYVRLAFAVAAHLEPEILVVDEVLAVGDAEFQKKALGKMQDISKGQGRTVLFVSHNMAAVKSLCSHAILLENGTIKVSGGTDEVISYYLTGGGVLRENYKVFDDGVSGCENVWINKIGARAKDKEFDEPITKNNAVEIVIEYNYITKIAERLDFTLKFKAEDGTYIFDCSTISNTNKNLIIGQNSFTLSIPENFFNFGNYFIDLLIVKNCEKIISFQKDIIAISINPNIIKIGSWMERSETYLTPVFEWKSCVNETNK